MTLGLAVTLIGLGFVGAFVAGLLGVGGAILMIPLLLYVPALLGVAVLDMKVVAAMSIVQVLFAALSGAVAHGRRGAIHRPLALLAGGGAATGALLGGLLSNWCSAGSLQVVFALMATLGTVLLLAAPAETEEPAAGPAKSVVFNRPLAAVVGLAVGIMGGLVGAGGAFILVPLLISAVKIPTRLTIGSSLAITLWTASMGFLGKLVTGQIPFLLSAALVAGALPGAQVGERVARRLRIRTLRWLLAAITGLVAVRIWVDIVRGWR